jgi:putative tricarboxylic transport membrane protein
MMYQGDFGAIFQRPIAATMLALAGLVLILPLLSYFNRARVRALAEEG